MREKLVEVTLIDGTTWYVNDGDVFNTFNVPEDPLSVIASFIRGSRGPFLRVNTKHTLDGEDRHINANYIISMKIYYDGNTPA